MMLRRMNVALAGVLTASVIVLTGACGGGGGSDCTSANAVKLTRPLAAMGFSFSPNCVTVAAGSTISILNNGVRGHNFTVKGTDIAVPLPPGQTSRTTAPAPGRYDFVCTLHPSMTGTIIVT